MTQSALHSCPIDTFGICGRCGGISCHCDPPAFAPPVSLQDTADSTDHRQGRGPLRPSSVRLPHRLRVLDGLRHCTYGADSLERVILTLRRLPEFESHHPVPVRLIRLRELHSHRIDRFSQREQRTRVNHDHSNAFVPQKSIRRGPRSELACR